MRLRISGNREKPIDRILKNILLLNVSLRHLQAGVVSLFGNLIPVFTLLFAFLFLGETVNVPQMACVGLALAGVLLSSVKKD